MSESESCLAAMDLSVGSGLPPVVYYEANEYASLDYYRRKEVLLTLNYKKGALFARYQLYRIGDQWVVLRIDLDKDPDKFFPRNGR